MKRKKPSFDESYYGYRSFTHLLEEADNHGAGRHRAQPQERHLRRHPLRRPRARQGCGRKRSPLASAVAQSLTRSLPPLRIRHASQHPGRFDPMVGPFKDNDRETRPTARNPGTTPWIAGGCLFLTIVVSSVTNSVAENPTATDRSAAASLNTLKAEIERLSTRLKTLQKRVESSSKLDLSSELDALRTKLDVPRPIDRGSGSPHHEGRGPRRSSHGHRQANRQFSPTGRGREGATEASHDSAQAAFPTHRPEMPPDGDISPGIEAFKASRYKEASDLFRG